MRRSVRNIVSAFVLLGILSYVCAGSTPVYATPVSEKQITIVNSDNIQNQVNAAIAFFQKLHPDIAIHRIDLDDDQLNVAVMAQQGDIDLIGLEYEQYLLYARQGALADLGENESIMNELMQWAPGTYEMLYVDGGLYALPFMMFSEATVLDGPLYRASGIVWPKGQSMSWSDLAALSENAQLGEKNGNVALLADFLPMPWPMCQYISLQASKNEYIDFDTDVFRKTMEAYKKLVISGAVIDSATNQERAIAYAFSWNISQIEDVERRLPPTLEGESVITTMPFVIAVNQSSDQLELAMEFMQCMAAPESQAGMSLDWYFLQDVSGYEKDEHYPEDDFAYREIMFNDWILWRSYPDLVVYCLSGVFTDYYDGKISVDELIDLMQAKMDMIQME